MKPHRAATQQTRHTRPVPRCQDDPPDLRNLCGHWQTDWQVYEAYLTHGMREKPKMSTQ